jgi:hypothetical protein
MLPLHLARMNRLLNPMEGGCPSQVLIAYQIGKWNLRRATTEAILQAH